MEMFVRVTVMVEKVNVEYLSQTVILDPHQIATTAPVMYPDQNQHLPLHHHLHLKKDAKYVKMNLYL